MNAGPGLLYVVTLNWNLSADTIACVESVVAAGVASERIVIVDNGSTDDSVRRFRTRFPTASLICNQRNLGFGEGMNQGIRHALERGASSVLILNNDTIIDPHMVTILVEAYDALEDAAILGPAIYYHDMPSRIWRLGDKRVRWLPMPLRVRRDPERCPSPFQVDYVTGCGMLTRREVFERIGLFDKRYFMYFEDADFCRRARDAGFTVWCVPQARMWHKVSLTAQRDKPSNRYHRALNQVRFYHEHPHGPLPLLREAYIVSRVAKTILSDVLHGDWNLIRPLWKGTADGYHEQRTAG
jgi:GT2 family glycosyltransferase